jgi:hypothetical protein
MSEVIRVIEVSDAVRVKINARHHLSEIDVEDALEQIEHSAWDSDAERGRRLLIRGRTRNGRSIRIVLYPIESEAGTWRLATAF